jgi:hypothetical protein
MFDGLRAALEELTPLAGGSRRRVARARRAQ